MDENSFRKVAEWLGWTWRPSEGCYKHHGRHPESGLLQPLPDFLNDESGSALIREKFKEPEIFKDNGLWCAIPDIMQEDPDRNPYYVMATHEDYKHAIFIAALETIDAEERRVRDNAAKDAGRTDV